MATGFEIRAEVRTDVGKGASRRLRRNTGRLPAIVYGGGDAPVNLVLERNQISRYVQEEAFFSSVLSLSIGGAAQQVLLRDMQRHPASGEVMHMDFQRIRVGEEIHTRVPLHFVGEDTCVGVKTNGGSLVHSIVEVEVACLPGNLPEFIAVDVSALDVGQAIHLSQLALPDGVRLLALHAGDGAEHDSAVISVQGPRGGDDAGAAGN